MCLVESGAQICGLSKSMGIAMSLVDFMDLVDAVDLVDLVDAGCVNWGGLLG